MKQLNWRVLEADVLIQEREREIWESWLLGKKIIASVHVGGHIETPWTCAFNLHSIYLCKDK